MNPIATLSKGGVDLNQGKEYGSLAGISDQEAEELCQALRQRVIQVVSQTGGHLASNLGAVELTVALHRVYDTSKDRLVFDVGHQCYVHKMLTGRNGRMETLRAFGRDRRIPQAIRVQARRLHCRARFHRGVHGVGDGDCPDTTGGELPGRCAAGRWFTDGRTGL